MPIRVFVYGSLKQGRGNHRLLEKSKFLGRCYIEGPHVMVSLGGYPGLVREESLASRKIVGEVYQINEETLQSLDWLEGHPRYYERKKVETPFKNAWVYYLPPAYLTQKYPDAGPIWQSSEEERAWFAGADNA